MHTALATTIQATTFLAIVLLAEHRTVVVSASPDAKVMIHLHPAVSVKSATLRVADVADVRGGDVSLRQRMAELDLADAPRAGEHTEITPRQIEFRLRVAGIDPRQVSIQGSVVRVTTEHHSVRGTSNDKPTDEPQVYALFAPQPKVRPNADVELDDAKIERAVLTAARKCLSKHLPWPEENVIIELAQSLPREVRERMRSDATTCSANLRTSATPLGRITLHMVVKAPDQRPLDLPVQLNVRRFEDVVVSTKPLARGHVFSSEDLELGRQDVTQLNGYCTSPEQLVGQKAKRILSATQVVRTIDVEPATRATNSLLIKRRDLVKVIARSGALEVTIVGEAMQDGRAGDVIKIQNLKSNAVLRGRVVSANEVEIIE